MGEIQKLQEVCAALREKLDAANRQIEKEHEVAGELKDGLVKQYAAFAKEMDAKDAENAKLRVSEETLILNCGERQQKIEALEIQNAELRNALQEICKLEGPGLDGSCENRSGKIARLALEGHHGNCDLLDPFGRDKPCNCMLKRVTHRPRKMRDLPQIILSDEDMKRLHELLDKPVELTPALKKLIDEHKGKDSANG